MVTEAEQKKLDEAKAAAQDKVGEKTVKTVDTIKFRPNSGSEIVFKVLEKAKKPLSLKEITERSKKAGIKNPARAAAVAKWFCGNNIAIKDDKGLISLKPKGNAEAKA